MEGEVHKHLKKVALRFLKERVTDVVCSEVEFGNAYSIADSVGLNFKRKEVRVVEVKATHEDFIRDKKLWGAKTAYTRHAHYSYIMCPTDVIQPSEVPTGYGLLWVDDYDNISIIKKPIKTTARLGTLFDTTMKRTVKTLTNQMLFKEENKEAKDFTRGKFSSRAKIWMIITKCPSCKEKGEYLIHKEHTKTVKCKCGNEIELEKAKVREVSGFNKKFATQFEKLMKGLPPEDTE